ncbi:hypothetical protein FGIG_00212 [Fasciola gigantica]|uniref:PDZ domain-containing protein n=1 Tax=Fasciola gigantica TaxID=46835 RepID=A0A504YUZ0_FASGI|nr:hypothetical protein FGIG_00212 [Fasciola gigantica]
MEKIKSLNCFQVENHDVSNLGPDETTTLMRHYIENDGLLEICLGVSYCVTSDVALQPTESLVSEVNRTLVVADVEQQRRASLSNTAQPTELESRDELNVLSRSIPSPEQRSGVQTDSGEENGRRTVDDDQRPVVSVVCPVIRDEVVPGERMVPTPLNFANVNMVTGGPASPPPPLPPRRFSRETKPIPNEVDQSLPIVTGDPVALYTRNYPPGDAIITVNLPLTDGTHTLGDNTETPVELVTTPCKVESLGIRLVGSRMPEKVATYIGGFCPESIAARHGELGVGDEIVQVGQFSVVGFSRLTVRRCLSRTIAEVISAWQSDGSDPSRPATLRLIVRRNPSNTELMASNHGSPERGWGNSIPDELLSPPVVPSRATAVSAAVFRDPVHNEANKDGSFPRVPTPVHRYPVSPEFVKQISKQLNESLFDLDIFDVELHRQGELQVHDRILAVNGIVPDDYDSTLLLLKQPDTKVRLTVGRQLHTESKEPSAPVASSSPAPHAPGSVKMPELPLPQPIVPGVKTFVELSREPNGTFGFSVVGGKDTMLGDILIHEVHANGVAARDGRLCTGDRLLAVNGVSLSQADHATALQAIRSAGDCLQLLIYRDLTPRFVLEDESQIISVTLVRQPGQNLGVSLVSRSPYSTGTAIGEVFKGTVADKVGLLQSGDVLVEINGRDVRLAQTPEVVSLLKESIGKIVIKVERTPVSRRPPYPPALPYYRLNVYTVVLQRPSPHTSQLSVTSGRPDKPPELGFTEPLLGPTNADPSFGLFVREATPEEVQNAGGHLIVQDIKSGSPADLSAMILPNDRLLSVDREPVDWLRPDEVFQLLAGMKSCSLELGRLNVGPPYPMDGTVGNASEPPYPPPSQELPELFGGVMPVIEPPRGIHEINTVEEEEDNEEMAITTPSVMITDNQFSNDPHSAMVDFTEQEYKDAKTTSETSSTIAAAVETRGPGMYQFRQLILPLAPAPPSYEGSPMKWSDVDRSYLRPGLGIRLVKGPGISGPVVVYVKSGSPAAQAGLRPSDRILGLDDSLLLAVASNRTTLEIVEMIEATWLARCVGSSEPPQPVYLTVISSLSAVEEPAKTPQENRTAIGKSSLRNGFESHNSRGSHSTTQRNGHPSPDSSSEEHPSSVQVNTDPNWDLPGEWIPPVIRWL